MGVKERYLKEYIDIELIIPDYEEKVNAFIKQKLKGYLDYEFRYISNRNNNPYFQLRKLEIEKLEKKFLSNNFIFEETLRNCKSLHLNLTKK